MFLFGERLLLKAACKCRFSFSIFVYIRVGSLLRLSVCCLWFAFKDIVGVSTVILFILFQLLK